MHYMRVLNSSKPHPRNNEKAKVWLHRGASHGDNVWKAVKILYEEKNYQSKVILDLMSEEI